MEPDRLARTENQVYGRIRRYGQQASLLRAFRLVTKGILIEELILLRQDYRFAFRNAAMNARSNAESNTRPLIGTATSDDSSLPVVIDLT